MKKLFTKFYKNLGLVIPSAGWIISMIMLAKPTIDMYGLWDGMWHIIYPGGIFAILMLSIIAALLIVFVKPLPGRDKNSG